jgi:hypothetical protein
VQHRLDSFERRVSARLEKERRKMGNGGAGRPAGRRKEGRKGDSDPIQARFPPV